MKLFGRKTKSVDNDVEEKVAKTVAPVSDINKEAKPSKKTVAKKIKETKEEVVGQKVVGTGKLNHVLLKPIVSEKATLVNAQNKYVFAVNGKTNKVEIKKAIKDIYGVTPEKVSIINHRGRFVHFGRKTGHTKGFKKAIVTLKKGDSIKIYEGI